MANMYPSKLASSVNPTETVLWTNSSPNSSFTNQTITLSQSLLNFQFLIIFAKRSTNTDTEARILVDTSHLSNGVSNTSPAFSTGDASSGGMLIRRFYRQSSTDPTKITFTHCWNASVSSAAMNSNINLIPTSIIGVNYQ